MNPHTHPHQGHGSSPISPHVSHVHPQGQNQPQPLPSIRGGFQLPPPVPSYATYAVGQGAGVGQGGSSSYYNNNYVPPPPPPQHSNTPPIGGVSTNPASSGTLSMHDFEPAGGGGVGGIASVLQPSSTYHTQYSASAPSAHPPPPQSHSPPQPSQNPTPAQPQQTPSPTLTSARRHTTKSIGKFITFASGPFKGRTVRAELVEVQKADLGRKCADPPTSTSTNPLYPSHSPSSSAGNVRDRDGPEGSNVGRDKDRLNKDREKEKEETKNVRKDRRPLDPPPVVSLKYFEMIHYGEEGQYEREIPAEDVEIGGLICQVDLFRVTIPPSEAEVQSMQMQAAQQIAHAQAMPLPGVHHYPPGSSLPGVYGSAPLSYQAPPGQQQLHQQWSATPPYDQQGGPTNQGPNYPYPPHPHQHLQSQSQSQPHPHLPPIDTQGHAQSPVVVSPVGGEDQRKRRRTGTISGQSAGIQGGLLRNETRFGRPRADSANESLSSRDRERLRDGDREDGRSRDRGDLQSSPVSPYAQTSQSHGYQHPYNPSASSTPYQNSSSSAYPPSSAYTPSSASTAFATTATAYTPPGSVGGVGPMGGGMGGMGMAGSSGPGAPINPDELPLPTEADKLTRCLFGEYYSHAASILDLKGKAVIYFVFSDLSVKLEGLFRPRYRFFDLFSRTSYSDDVPVLAECFGGTFAVYSTKEFPGLKASTELTKHLNRWGIRVNIRETERKRRAGTTSAPVGPAGRRGSEEEEGDSHLSPGSGAGAQSQGHQIMDAPRRFLEGTAAQREKERGQRERAATARASRPDGAGSSGKVKKAKRKRSPARKS